MRTAELRHVTMIARVVVFAMILLGGIAAPMRAAALPVVTVVPPPDGGEVPDAVIDSQGRIHLVYVKSDDAYYVTSTDQGRTFSHPLRINSDPGTVQPPGMFRGPVVALGKDDQVHVVWWVNAHPRKRPKNESGVYYSQLNPTRDAFLPARNINMRPSDNYSVAADRHGNVAVIWTAEAVYANLSRDGGKTFGAPMLANPSVDACECCATRALFGTEDQLYALYRDKAGNMRDMYLLRLDKGAEAFVRTPVSVTRWSFNACPMAGSSLAHWGNKGLVAAWEREFKIYFARMDFTGQLLPPGEILAPGQGKYPVVLSASTGATLVGWKDATRMRWQVYDAAGRPEGGVGSAPVASRFRPGGVVTKEGAFVLFP
jgi:hypothetical protein